MMSCYSGGNTMEEATAEIQDALRFYIERTSKATHLKLIKLAEEQDVSVSHLINDAIIKQYG